MFSTGRNSLALVRVVQFEAVVRRAAAWMVCRPTKRPMPWSTCTTRSPAARLVTSAMKSCGRASTLRGGAPGGRRGCPARRRRRGRRSRTRSRGRARPARSRSCAAPPAGAPGNLTLVSLDGLWSASTLAMRSREPSDPQRDTMRFLPPPAARGRASTAASNTLTSASARSGAKLRPCRVPSIEDVAAVAAAANGREPRQRAALPAAASTPLRSRVKPPRAAAACRACRRRARMLQRLARAPRSSPLICVKRSRAASSACGSITTGVPGEIVEQRVELFVEQRQPVLHAGMAAAFADRLVERIVALAARRRLAT